MSDPRDDFKRIVGMTRGGVIAAPKAEIPDTPVLLMDTADAIDLDKVHTYEDCESQLITLMQSRDRNAFSLGDVLQAFEVHRGYPLDRDATLGKLASKAGCLPSQLSMWRAVAAFFPKEQRTFETLRWSHYYQAMMHSAGTLDNALESLIYAHDNDLSVNDFRNHLKGKPKETPATPTEEAQDERQEPVGYDDMSDGEIMFRDTFTGARMWELLGNQQALIPMIPLEDDAQYEVRIVRVS